MACSLKISTWASATTSTTEWYKNEFKTTVDGDTTNNAGAWSSFIAVPHAFPSLGQKANTGTGKKYMQAEKDVETNMWLWLSSFDKVVSTLNSRLFPFDTTGSTGNTGKTTASLHIRNYGSGLKSSATFTAAVTAALFDSKNSMFGKQGTFSMAFGAASTAVKLDGDTATGYLSMTYIKATWGGTCCVKYADCKTKGKKVDGTTDNTASTRF